MMRRRASKIAADIDSAVFLFDFVFVFFFRLFVECHGSSFMDAIKNVAVFFFFVSVYVCMYGTQSHYS